MSEEFPGKRQKGYPSDMIKKALEELLVLKPKDPFIFLARYFQHISSKSEALFLSFKILTKNFNNFDFALGEAYVLLSRDSDSGVQIKDVLGLCSFFHEKSSLNNCQKYLGCIYKQYSSKNYVDFSHFRKIIEYHCVLYDFKESLNQIFNSKTLISGLDLKNVLLKYQNFSIGSHLLRITVSDTDLLDQNQIFDHVNTILNE